MSTVLADQHTEWHQIYGKYQTCPLDCAAGEAVTEFFEADAEALEISGERGIKCGSCKGRHATAAAVKFCSEVKYESETFARCEAEMAKKIDEAGSCEHGLSAALCTGPNHW